MTICAVTKADTERNQGHITLVSTANKPMIITSEEAAFANSIKWENETASVTQDIGMAHIKKIDHDRLDCHAVKEKLAA